MKEENKFERFSYSIIIVVLISFIAAFLYQYDSQPILQNIIVSMAFAGFVGMFGQFALTIAKEYYSNETYEVCFLYKESVFSNAILRGIEGYFLNIRNVKLTSCGLKRSDCIPIDDQISNFLKKEGRKFNGLIILPNVVTDDIAEEINDYIKTNKPVVLVDTNLTDDQYRYVSKPDLLAYVGSNFADGGKLIGEFINNYVEDKIPEPVQIILIIGPKDRVPHKKRNSDMLYSIFSGNNHQNCSMIHLRDYDLNEALKSIILKFEEWYVSDDVSVQNKDVIIYCGYDALAIELMKILNDKSNAALCNFLSETKKIIFIGYDGLKESGSDSEYKLGLYGFEYVTVDVLPTLQGNYAAEKLFELLTSDNPGDSIKLVRPKIIRSYVSEKTDIAKSNSIYNFERRIYDKKAFLFDFDGTIANTEPIHWKAYNECLSEMGIVFSEKDIQKYIGNTELEIYRMIKEDFHIDFINEVFFKKRISIFMKLVKEIGLKPFEYFIEILEEEVNTDFFILSSQQKWVIEEILDLWKIRFKFKKIISVSDGELTKKDVMSDTIKYLGLPQGEILLFEDTNKYLETGKIYNITTAGVENTYNRFKISNCDVIVSDYFSHGIFVGLCGMDLIYYLNDYPGENYKTRTQDYVKQIGGPAANAAITYSLLGGNSTLISAIGDSLIGKVIKDELIHKYNVKVVDVLEGNNKILPGISSILINETNGSRTVFSGQAKADIEIKIDLDKVTKNALFCLSDCNNPDLTFSILGYMRKKKIPIVLDAGSWKKESEYYFSVAKEIIASASCISPRGNALDEAMLHDVQYAAVTDGGNPTEVYSRGSRYQIIPPSVDVVDTLASGDVLHGAFCYYRYIEHESFDDALKKSTTVASISVKFRGPREGVEKYIKI